MGYDTVYKGKAPVYLGTVKCWHEIAAHSPAPRLTEDHPSNPRKLNLHLSEKMSLPHAPH